MINQGISGSSRREGFQANLKDCRPISPVQNGILFPADIPLAVRGQFLMKILWDESDGRTSPNPKWLVGPGRTREGRGTKLP